ncbi:MAG TPA: hypothetical protein VIM73_01600, partial [Polyangiaceae bacterium]
VLALAPAVASAQEQQGDLNTGGLAPPPAIESEAPQTGPTATEQELERAEREDAGRGLSFFWVNGEVGYGLLGLQTFRATDLVDSEIVESTQNGLVFGVGAGVKLIFVSLGARFRMGMFDQWQIWTLNAEGGVRIPFGRLEPYFTLGGGYAAVGSFDERRVGGAFEDMGMSAEDLDVRGFNVRGGVGLDYFVGRIFSVGANLSGDVLFLTRSSVDAAGPGGSGSNADAAAIYAEDGSSIGGALTLTAVAGLHF